MAFDEQLAARIRGLLEGNLDVSEKKMFGGLAFLCRGKMFAGVVGTALMARIGKQASAEALQLPHIRPMDFTGKPMTGYIFIDPPAIAEDPALEHWLELGLKFIDTLPPT